MRLTDLNLEQSIARYLADKFIAAGYQIYWWDTKRLEGSGNTTLTFVREFPENPTYLVEQSATQQDHLIRVPALAVSSIIPARTTADTRLGIGESVFEWRADVRVDGFASSELEWYRFREWFADWMGNPDHRVDLRDYGADLTNPNPVAAEEKMQFVNPTVVHQELSGPDIPKAARYYVSAIATVVFLE